MFDAHMLEGTVALWDGDVSTARAHLKALTTVPVTGGLPFKEGVASNHLTRYLLKAGERDSVADYCDRMAGVSIVERQYPDSDGAGDSGGQNA